MTKEKLYRVVYDILRPIAALVYPQRISGVENIPEGPAIFCAPHSNIVDPILVSLALGRDTFTHHLAKAESKTTFIFGWVMKKAGSIFVKRGERDIDSFKQCMRVLKAGEKLIVFPEGTRVHGDAVVEPKSGVIHMSVRLHVPIVPVYIPRDKKVFRKVPTVIGEPYYPEVGDHRDYDRLARELMGRIWALKPEE